MSTIYPYGYGQDGIEDILHRNCDRRLGGTLGASLPLSDAEYDTPTLIALANGDAVYTDGGRTEYADAEDVLRTYAEDDEDEDEDAYALRLADLRRRWQDTMNAAQGYNADGIRDLYWRLRAGAKLPGDW